jgi:hypothetical protein
MGKQAEITGRLYTIEWSNPYTQPPGGAPRVLAEMFVPNTPGSQNRTPSEIETFPYSLGGGYSMYSRHVSPPPRGLSQKSLAKVRRKRLARRVNAKVPMFADHFTRVELNRKPDYYAGITDQAIEERRLARIEEEHAAWQEYWSRPNQLVVYGQEPEACRHRAEQIWKETQSARERFSRHQEQVNG